VAVRCFATELTDTEYISAGDLDNDADLDLLVSGVLYRNDGAGYMTRSARLDAIGGGRTDLADVNRDGFLDVVAAGLNVNFLERGGVLLNDRVGSFFTGRSIDCTNTAVVRCLPEDLSSYPLIAGDLTGDGALDLIGGGPAAFYPNDGAGSFANALPFADGGRGELELADIDSDGALDVVFRDDFSSTVVVYLNRELNGARSLVAGPTFTAVGTGTTLLATGDLNADGALDVIYSTRQERGLALNLNDGGGTYSAGQRFTLGGQSSRPSVIPGDVDLTFRQC